MGDVPPMMAAMIITAKHSGAEIAGRRGRRLNARLAADGNIIAGQRDSIEIKMVSAEIIS